MLVTKQEKIPSVIIILVQWRPEQANWREQEQLIAAQVDQMKKRATNRNTKFVLLIVTKSKPKDISILISNGTILSSNFSSSIGGGHSSHHMAMDHHGGNHGGGGGGTLAANIDPSEIETLKVDDFYTSLKKLCGMDSLKHVQQIEETELNKHAVINAKLGKILQELSVQYYKEQAMRVKRLKSEVSMVGQPYLFVRHRFKVAYFSEISMRGFAQGSTPLTSTNNQKVVKYLMQAYSYLMVINPRDHHGIGENELKSVGDIINYRICQLKFTDRKTVDQAVKQFLKHISWYKSLSSDHLRRGLIFKHHALVYRQYRMFGEMLESLPTGYLKKEDSYHNPGYYFQAAASQAKLRKFAALKLLGTANNGTSDSEEQQSVTRRLIELLLSDRSDVMEDLKRDCDACYDGYYGQQIDMDPQSFVTSQNSAQVNEWMSSGNNKDNWPNRLVFRDLAKEALTVRHSEDIISMLMKAYNNYKKYQTMKRLTYSISSSIAEEHYHSKQWERAKMFFDRIAKTYKKEQWFDLYTSVRRLSLMCAREMAKPKDYLTCLIDLISTKLDTSVDEKQNYLTELLQFLDGSDSSGVSALDAPLVIEVDPRHVVLGMTLQFEKPFVCVHEPTNLNIQFQCYSPLPIKFQKLNVQFKKKSYNFTLTDGEDLTQVFTYPTTATTTTTTTAVTSQTPANKDTSAAVVTDANNANDNSDHTSTSKILNLTLRSNGEPTTFTFPMIIKEKQEFECETVNLYMVGSSGQQICFQWKMHDNKYYSRLISDYDHRYEVGKNALFVERPVIRVTEPKPKLEIKFEHRPPALINEQYAVKVLLNTNDDSVIRGILQINPITNVRISQLIHNSGADKSNGSSGSKLVELSSEPSVMVDAIPSNTTKEIVLFLQCVQPGMIRLKVNFAYESTTYPSLSQSSDLDIYVQYPFDATFTYMGTRTTSRDNFRLVPLQNISFFQKIINNTIQNVAVHDPLRPQSLSLSQSGLSSFNINKNDNQFRFNEGFPAHQQIILSTSLTCNTPYPILVDRIRFAHAEQADDGLPNIECCSDQVIDFEEKRTRDDKTNVPASFIEKNFMEQRDAYTLCHVLKANISGKSIKAGSMVITCHRQNPLIPSSTSSTLKGESDKNGGGGGSNVVDPSLLMITYEVPLPSLNIYYRNVRATFDSPSEATLGKPFEATLTVYNESSTLQELQLSVAESDSFFFSGTTLINFTMLPYSERKMVYIMIPVLTGHITFPKFTLKATREQAHVLTESERWSIFVHMT